MNLDASIKAMQALNLKDGDVVVVTVDSFQSQFQVDAILDRLEQVFGSTQNKVLIHDESIKVEQFSEEQMNAAGWYRK